MTIPYKPELSGVKAIYVRSDDETEQDSKKVYRRVIAWDKLGRPLVLVDDRLYPAADALFESYRKFTCLEPSTEVEETAAAALQGEIADRFYGINLRELVSDALEKAIAVEVVDRFYDTNLRGMVYQAVEKAVAVEVSERFGDIDLKKILRVAVEKAVAHKVNSSGKEN